MIPSFHPILLINDLPILPYSDKYKEDAWEWTIGRDFKDRLNGMILSYNYRKDQIYLR